MSRICRKIHFEPGPWFQPQYICIQYIAVKLRFTPKIVSAPQSVRPVTAPGKFQSTTNKRS